MQARENIKAAVVTFRTIALCAKPTASYSKNLMALSTEIACVLINLTVNAFDINRNDFLGTK